MSVMLPDANACWASCDGQRVFWPVPRVVNENLKSRYHSGFDNRKKGSAGAKILARGQQRRWMIGGNWEAVREERASVNNAGPKPRSESLGGHVRPSNPCTEETVDGRSDQEGIVAVKTRPLN
jgi:hypothetical protein